MSNGNEATGPDGIPRDVYLGLVADAAFNVAADAGMKDFAPGSVVTDEVTGAVGRIRDVYGDGSAYVVFPGGGGRMISPWDMNLAADQDWEPEGGWGA